MSRTVSSCVILFVILPFGHFQSTTDQNSCELNGIECPRSSSSSKKSNEWDEKVSFWDSGSDALWTWLHNQKNQKATTFCQADSKLELGPNEEVHKALQGPFECPPQGSLIRFQGTLGTYYLLSSIKSLKSVFGLNLVVFLI